MKVLHAISSAGMYGAEAVVLALCRAMNRDVPGSAALAVFHNTAQPNQALYEAAKAAGIETHLVTANGRVDVATAGALAGLSNSVHADLLHTHGYKADIYGYFAARHAQMPLISTCHNWCDTDVATRVYGWLDRMVLRRFDAIASVSADVQQRLVQSGVPGSLIHMIRNGIDVVPFQRAARVPVNPLTVGYAGRLSWEKGIDLFVEAAGAVLQEVPDTRFLVAGDGPERSTIERSLVVQGLQDHVVLLGRRDDMPDVYAQLDVLRSSSRTEGLPVGLMEAMAGKLPVVATSVGDVPILVEDGVTGLLVQPTDVAAMAAATVRLLRSAELRTRLATAAAERVSSAFSDTQMARDYLDLYRHALGHFHARSR